MIFIGCFHFLSLVYFFVFFSIDESAHRDGPLTLNLLNFTSLYFDTLDELNLYSFQSHRDRILPVTENITRIFERQS